MHCSRRWIYRRFWVALDHGFPQAGVALGGSALFAIVGVEFCTCQTREGAEGDEVRAVRWTRESRKSWTLVVLVATWLAATPALSATPDEAQDGREEDATAADSRKSVADSELVVPTGRRKLPEGEMPRLDALLQLPSGFVTTEPRAVAGASQSEWRRRFSKADRDLSEARMSLESTKRELEGVAAGGSSSQWSIAPPGAETGPSTSPLSFKLRQQLRGDREQITTSEKALRALRIEADLAGVPQNWRATNQNSAGAETN